MSYIIFSLLIVLLIIIWFLASFIQVMTKAFTNKTISKFMSFPMEVLTKLVK